MPGEGLIEGLNFKRHDNTERSICTNSRGRKPAQSAKDGKRARPTMHITYDNNVTQLHKRNNRLSISISNDLLAYYYISALIPSQIQHTLFDIISLGVDAVLCHDQDTCRQFTLVHVVI